MALVIFVVLVVGFDLVLRRTRYGRSIFAVGGNIEAARRAGISVDRDPDLGVRAGVTLAAIGGILAASRQYSVARQPAAARRLLLAIAAAVIGGTSLFGGRGSTLLGAARHAGARLDPVRHAAAQPRHVGPVHDHRSGTGRRGRARLRCPGAAGGPADANEASGAPRPAAPAPRPAAPPRAPLRPAAPPRAPRCAARSTCVRRAVRHGSMTAVIRAEWQPSSTHIYGARVSRRGSCRASRGPAAGPPVSRPGGRAASRRHASGDVPARRRQRGTGEASMM